MIKSIAIFPGQGNAFLCFPRSLCAPFAEDGDKKVAESLQNIFNFYAIDLNG